MSTKRGWSIAVCATLGACNVAPPSGGVGVATSSDGDPSATSGGADEAGSEAASTGAHDKLDVAPADLPAAPDPCHTGQGSLDFSFIWVANSPEGTVSKIDTASGIEVARYRTGPGLVYLEPSRTSVNLVGDAVVVNRGGTGGGSITKIAATLDRCVDTNANGKIDTSDGPDDVLSFSVEECVLWNRPLESVALNEGPRPVAWEGQLDEDGCAAFDPRVWVGFYQGIENRGVFRRLDGSTGEVLDEVVVEDWGGFEWGPYGGAITAEGDFVVLGWQRGPLVRIDGVTLDVDRWELPSSVEGGPTWAYGIALDPGGNPWITAGSSALTFDMQTEQWTEVPTTNSSMRGIAVDSQWRVWMVVDGGVDGCGVGVIDAQTRTVLADVVPIAGCNAPVGVSVDPEGMVWVVDQEAEQAFKIDPDTYDVLLSVSGLNQPYTYSDMTGGGLSAVVFPPG